VEDRLYAALGVLRVVVTLNMLGLTLWRWQNFDRPLATLVVVAGLVAWTAFALLAYRVPRRRTTALLVTDLAVAACAMAATPWLKGEEFRATLPGFWVMGALLAWAIHWHWRGGLVAGTVLAVVDVAIRSELTQTNYGHIFLLLLGGTVVGYMCQSLQEMAAERAHAERAAAAAAERTRLARAVHDGVLQVLSLVQRAGRDGEWAELGRLAGEQETRLRSLIHAQDNVAADGGGGADAVVDVSAALEPLASGTVTVVTPGVRVPMPAARAEQLVAAVAACLDNVRLHVGLDAPAWVLLEQLEGRVAVSVRDEGPGIPAERLVEAVRQGRLGVASSIRGRVAELGGSCELVTGAHGTEWEMVVPVEEPGGTDR
jgi:signal transduction histidine kinase